MNDNYKLIMVGNGPLRKSVERAIEELGIGSCVKIFDRIPNCDIWQLYCIAETFVNLNQQEIFGMVILEAMYYGCKVVAWKAPGPNFIIEHRISGCLCDSDKEIIDSIVNCDISVKLMRERVLNHFTWNSVAKTIINLT